MGLLDGFLSLMQGSPNAVEGDADNIEGVISDMIPELRFDKPDEDLLENARRWKSQYAKYDQKIRTKQDENEKYWLGTHFNESRYRAGKEKPAQENRIFSDVESFLPIATRANPEPLVSGGDTEEGQSLSLKTAKMLAFETDVQKLKLKIKNSVRYWMLYMVGVVKFGWDTERDNIKTQVIRPQKMIFEVGSTIDADGYTGKYLGEYRDATAKELMEQFPSKAGEIKKLVDKSKGTSLGFIEWWTDEYVFWTLSDKLVLGKMKNPHWNYEEERDKLDEFGEGLINELGEAQRESIQMKNHFARPRMPYAFLSVFNLGKQPHDDSNLIQQNIPTQDKLNKRLEQIDKNVDDMNGGAVVSGDHFTQEQAGAVANAVKRGDTVWVPTGDVNAAFKRQTGTPLPSDVYHNLNDLRAQMDNQFGIHGTTRGERQGSETLGGRILLKNADVDRISFIADYIEQFTDQIYNYWVQMMHVYYTEEKVAAVLGAEGAQEYVRLSREDFNVGIENDLGEVEPITLLISVREGSMIPKDPLLQRNEAVELFSAGAMDPITLFERLDFPNPKEAAEKLFLWINNPQALFESQVPEAQPQSPAGFVPTPEDVDPNLPATQAPSPEQDQLNNLLSGITGV